MLTDLERTADGRDFTVAVTPTRQVKRRYGAFISYSHADEEIADWLHRKLEGYVVPRALVGREGPVGPIGRKLGRMFRDRVDLSAAHDLGGEIREALQDADALIVVCSPRSCMSRYVHEEIRTFKALGRGDRIFAAIVDGEPHAAGKPAWRPEDECFSPALIYALDANGAISRTPEPTEPIAADFRDGKDGRENGALKIIAGLMDVGLDELLQRERTAQRRRLLTAYGIAGFTLLLAVTAVAAGLFANKQYNVAQTALDKLTVALEGEQKALGVANKSLRSERLALSQKDLALSGEAAARLRAEQRLAAAFGTRGEAELTEGRVTSALRYGLAGVAVAHGQSPESADLLRRVQFSLAGSGLRSMRAPPGSTAAVETKSDDWTLAATCVDGRRIAIQRIATSDVVSSFDVPGCGPDFRREKGMYVEFSPDNRRIAYTAGKPARVQVHDVASGRAVGRMPALDPESWSYGTFNADFTRMYVQAEFTHTDLWNLETGQRIRRWPTSEMRGFTSLGPDTVWASRPLGDPVVVDFEGRTLREIGNIQPKIYAVSPDGEWFVWGPLNYGHATLARTRAQEDVDLPEMRDAVFVGNDRLAAATWRDLEGASIPQVVVISVANPGGGALHMATFPNTPSPRDIEVLPSGDGIAGRYAGGMFTWLFEEDKPVNYQMPGNASIHSVLRDRSDFLAVIDGDNTLYTFYAGESYSRGPSPETLPSFGFSPGGRDLLFWARNRIVARAVDTGRRNDGVGRPITLDGAVAVTLRGPAPQVAYNKMGGGIGGYGDINSGRDIDLSRGVAAPRNVNYSISGVTRLVTVPGRTSTLRLEDVATGRVLRTLTVPDRAYKVELAADSQHAVVHYSDGQWETGHEYWDLTAGRRLFSWEKFAYPTSPRLTGDQSAVASVEFDGATPARLVIMGTDGRVRCHARITVQNTNTMSAKGSGGIVMIARDSTNITDVQLVDSRTCATTGRFTTSRDLQLLAFDRTGTRILARAEGATRVIDSRTGDDITSYAHENCRRDGSANVDIAAFTPDDQRIVDVCGNGYRVINATSGRVIAERVFGAPYNLPFIYRASDIVFDDTGDRVGIFGDEGLGVDDISMTRRPLDALVRDACDNHLSFGASRFSDAELRAEPLLRDVWRTRAPAAQDVCAGL